MNTNSTVRVFAVLDLLFAALSLVGLGVLSLIWTYGIFFSGDPIEDKIQGSFGVLLFALPVGVFVIVFLAAGIGLWKQREWGYYVHIAAAVLAALSIVGVIYTILALLFAFQPEFKAAFFDQPATQRG